VRFKSSTIMVREKQVLAGKAGIAKPTVDNLGLLEIVIGDVADQHVHIYPPQFAPFMCLNSRWR
jgi:hypothetical protein